MTGYDPNFVWYGQMARFVEPPKVEQVASECDLYGHREWYVTTEPGSQEPVRLGCGRCGKSWKVER